MVRFNVKKVAATVAALSLVACMAAVPASASDTQVELTIGNETVPLSEAPGKTVTLPITLDAPALSSFQFMVEVPGSIEDGLELGIKKDPILSSFDFGVATQGARDGTVFLNWANGAMPPEPCAVDINGEIATISVTLPEDVKPGKYEVNYVVISPNGKEMEWNDADAGVSYVDTVLATNGWIEIVDDTASTTTTEAPATTTTEAPATTTTEAPADTTTAPVDTTTGTGTNTGVAGETTTTVAGGGTTTAASSTGSPQTGSSDVLPIAGAAAAVAVLGGVALVAKKKND